MDIHKHRDTLNPPQRLIDTKKTQRLSLHERSTYKDKEKFSDLETSKDTNTLTQITSLRN